MKSSKKREVVHGNEQFPKFRKHDVNLPNNGIIRFQVGLLIALTLVYLLINLPFIVKAATPLAPAEVDDELIEFTMGEFKVEKEKVAKEVRVEASKKVVNPVAFTAVDNQSAQKESVITVEAPEAPLSARDVLVAEEEDEPVYVNAVEFAPLFPGCDADLKREERIACMSKQIDRYILRYFDVTIAEQYGFNGLQRILTQFTIDESGKISEVLIRAPHPALEREARRVISRLPEMVPGRQGSRAVKVIFVKPILFRVD